MEKDNSNALNEMIEKAVKYIELVIAIAIAIGIAIGIVDLLRYFPIIFETETALSYDIFHDFLGHALLLIVGAELILMILYHSTNALLELILFVIARKMLIYSDDVMDLIYGTVALLLVFFTMKYLLPNTEDSIFSKLKKSSSEKDAENNLSHSKDD